ncbi:fungal-specific transcription factor domain-containing protein [Nemania sp. FL0916]|nr:fungal-specific transcription factor domain-containing protein [Nemania sp. FL0916]
MSVQDAAPIYSGPGNTPRGRARLPSSRRRDKPQLSCNLCRRRKLKCNRHQPCNTCARLGLASTCLYAVNNLSENEPDQTLGTIPRMQDRIQQLENLVSDLMRNATGRDAVQRAQSLLSRPMVNDSPASTARDADHLETSSVVSNHGSMKLGESGPTYVNSSHWATVLEEISELKDHLEAEAGPQRFQGDSDLLYPFSGPQLLYGCPGYASKAEILASVPPRPVVDRLISRYFSSFDMSPVVLHTTQFLKEYEQFWANPPSIPIVWLGLLFTIMCLATQFQKFSIVPGSQPQPGADHTSDLDINIRTYRLKAVQCLVLGKYATGGAYVLETLMLYFSIELFLCTDADVGVWILLGITVQLAMHMGYHKDPSHFEGMSAFAGEMRRRIWATIVELDLGVSAQMGLPRLIKPWQSDTAEPRNLLDTDFHGDIIDLPPSRPATENTTMLYRLGKSRMMAAFGLIWDFAADIRSHPPDEVTTIDNKLEEALKKIPDCLQWESMAHCILDSPQIILQKMVLHIIYYRAKIVLHRKCIDNARSEDQYTHSRDVCLDAAFKLLELQYIIDENTRPFCQLYHERWRISSLINHDFLLATSILCLYLQKIKRSTTDEGESALVRKIIEVLEKSHSIWLRSSDVSKEAWKVTKALSIVIGHRSPSYWESQGEGDNSACSRPVAGYNDMSPGHQERSLGHEITFPFIDTRGLGNWRFMIDEPVGPSSMPAPVSSTHELQIPYFLDTIGSFQWPWQSI